MHVVPAKKFCICICFVNYVSVIPQVCAASKQTSLAGLDNIAADGMDAFDTLVGLADSLGKLGEFWS